MQGHLINSINTLELGESECPDLVGEQSKHDDIKIDLIEATHDIKIDFIETAHDIKIDLIGNFR